MIDRKTFLYSRHPARKWVHYFFVVLFLPKARGILLYVFYSTPGRLLFLDRQQLSIRRSSRVRRFFLFLRRLPKVRGSHILTFQNHRVISETCFAVDDKINLLVTHHMRVLHSISFANHWFAKRRFFRNSFWNNVIKLDHSDRSLRNEPKNSTCLTRTIVFSRSAVCRSAQGIIYE